MIKQAVVKDVIQEIAGELSSNSTKLNILLYGIGNSVAFINVRVYSVDTGTTYSESITPSIEDLDESKVKYLIKTEVQGVIARFLINN